MSRFTIQAFGGLQVFAEQRPLSLPAKKVQALLAYLALHPGRPQARAKLAAMLWGDSSEAQARASLRQALLVLRKSLGLAEDELIAGPGETIELAPDCAEVDIRSFERLLDDGTPESLQQAAQRYTGELLEGLETREAQFDDWLMFRRQQLRERVIAGLTRLLAMQSDSGQLDRAVETGLRLLAIDPLQESVHRELMQLYARQGRAASALRQFQLCRDVLARELGTRPQAQTLQLRDAIERQRRAPAPTSLAEEDASPTSLVELRLVAIVTAEMSLRDDADPESLLSSSDGLATQAAQIVARFGGTLERRVETSVTAFFGVPISHSNDLARAARYALALRDAMRGLRLGIAAGSALVIQRRETAGPPLSVTGDAVGLAARLAAAAGAGEILVADSAWRDLGHGAQGVQWEQAALPASLRAVRCWTLRAIGAAPDSRTPLIGRRTELTQFASSLQACKEQKAGLTIHVRGEPGIGKSRLVEEFRSSAEGLGFACHGGTVLDFGSGAERDALRALVQGLLGIKGDGAAAAHAATARAVAAGFVDASHEMHLLDLLHQPLPDALRPVFDAMDHASREREQNQALAQLLQRCSEIKPRMLVLEDLHWATPRALSRAATLAATAERCGAVLVTTARNEGDPLDAAWRSTAGVSALITFDLGPLRWAEANALAAQFGDANDAFAIRCVERSGGNPLFLEQLLQAGRDSATLPGSVQSVVQARLDALGAAERHAIRVASVLGQRFALTALSRLLDGASWDPHLAQNLARIDGSDGVFAHALVREGAYASLPRSLRLELHAKAAQWFTGRDVILRAEHLDRAEDRNAVQAYLEAAQAQAGEHRHERALQLAERGLELARGDGPNFALACTRAEALYELGAMVPAQGAYEAALAIAAHDSERCRAWLGLAAVLRIRDDLAGAEAALVSAERAAAAHGLHAQRARIHFMRGNLLFPKGDLDGCQREHEHSLAFARAASSVELEAGALGGLGDAAFLRGHMLTARERFGGCVAVARAHDLRRVAAANLPMLAFARWFCGEGADALVDAQAAVAAAAQIGHRRAEAVAHHACYQFHQALMQLDAAPLHADRALDLAREIHAPRFEAEALAFRGQLLCTLGQRNAAVDALHEALTIARATGMSYMGPVFLGMLAMATEDPSERAAGLAEAEALLATVTIGHNHLLFRRDAIDACLQVAAWTDASRHAAELEAWARPQPLPWTDFFVARGRALARNGARPDDAATLEELRILRGEGERLGQRVALIAIDAALGAG